MWGASLEAHGGYLVRLDTFAGLELLRLAREALVADMGELFPHTQLLVSVSPRRKVIRLAYLGPLTAGRLGAYWHDAHQTLPRLLSQTLTCAVHAYVYDPDAGEEVIAYGNGRQVGGERVVYEDVELPGTPEQVDEAAFAHMQSRWPIGHLAYIFNLTREELLTLPRSPSSMLLNLEGPEPGERLDVLLPRGSMTRAA
jgi:hypothetical protein